MYAKKILFPTDFSEASVAALEHAESLARETGATLLIVHVSEPNAAFGGGEAFYFPEDDEEARWRQLAEVVPRDPLVKYKQRLLSGDSAKAIVRFAETENVDFIVMGTHGRTGLARLVMGSVAEAVVRRASCPVLTIKQPHDMVVLED